eukprot:CAMPEP_0195103914 /NCGR_PEP_ID=MMETSP0448-20130528/72795_1 /TAXON_ID=66468 /ORGANISM="Heterocapsa triquestra, Strain CCMP 448" /LENGTH=55 /DNA_ID=CAMNT_0040139671 /DNA_START=77 /DNA_END=244 /DNA_ORIENTATION=-
MALDRGEYCRVGELTFNSPEDVLKSDLTLRRAFQAAMAARRKLRYALAGCQRAKV